MNQAQLAAYLAARMTPGELIAAFNAETLAAGVVDELVDRSTSGDDFLKRYDDACTAQTVEYQRLLAENEQLEGQSDRLQAEHDALDADIRSHRAATRRAKRRIRELGG